MTIGCLQAKLSIPEARSLKDKRMVLRSLKDRMLNKMNVSVAEVDHQDLWQSCVLAVVTVAAEKETVEQRLADVSEFIRSNPQVVLLDVMVEIL
ncbi:MAG: DUF503 domain-containing protein [Kiritimatiellae bacterium]|nr:DUF503 domain-containing protein [Kiritimatiellia bacterium]MDW8457872.1 DUF503 domain-containing protein [Verrucomicrobiota bacterium]